MEKNDLIQNGIPGAENGGEQHTAALTRLDVLEKIMQQQKVQRIQFEARMSNIPAGIDTAEKLCSWEEIKGLLLDHNKLDMWQDKNGSKGICDVTFKTVDDRGGS